MGVASLLGHSGAAKRPLHASHAEDTKKRKPFAHFGGYPPLFFVNPFVLIQCQHLYIRADGFVVPFSGRDAGMGKEV